MSPTQLNKAPAVPSSEAVVRETPTHYRVIQIFDSKWQRKMQGPASSCAWEGVARLSELKMQAASYVRYPVIAVQIHDMDHLGVVYTYNPQDGWIERPIRRGWF